MNALLTPIATFKDSAGADNRLSFMNKTNDKYMEDHEFVAIAEGNDIPIYIITYNIEMTQFIYTDLMVQP